MAKTINTPDGPKFTRPTWRDPQLVAEICVDLRRGVSEMATSLRHGMAERTVAAWLSLWRKAVLEGDESQPEFLAAITPIARARGEWVAEMEERAQAGDSGAQWMLPRRVQDVYGQKQEVSVSTTNDAGVAKLLARLAGDAP